MTDFLPRAVMLRLLAVLAIVLTPHLVILPWWERLLVGAIMLWRLVATLRQWPALPRWLRIGLTVGAFAGVYFSFGNISGQYPGVALLTVMACLKLTEMDKRRDVRVMVLLMYFVLITHFLFSQEIWTVAYLLLSGMLITALLVEANHPDSALPLRVSLRLGGRLVLHAVPLMAVLFVLFPRIPGPLWGLPTDAGASRSGLGDDMTPGDIRKLIESDEVAFRVSFNGRVPAPEQMYWRGPVLSRFDGKTWTAGDPVVTGVPAAEFDGPQYDYEITLEPQRRHWLLALDLPTRAGLPQDAALNPDYTLVAKDEVKDRRFYHLVSHTRYHLQTSLTEELKKPFLQLRPYINPRTRALAQQWRAQGLDDRQIVAAALAMFREKDFYYTLDPPDLKGENAVDDFLFGTRKGFCEHYSSSFTVLMRAAGIPARVVTGYQGGTRNQYGDYYLVRQSDAHAWSEVWLADSGWTRVDPTAAVAPQRIVRGIGAALEGSDNLPGYLDPNSRGYHLRALLEARWDWVNAEWNRWVLGYGPDLQQELLARLGLVDWSDMILALTVAICVILGLLSLSLLREFLPRREADPVLQLWLKVRKRLARAGFEQRPDEGPLDFTLRVCAGRPDLATAMDRVCALYLRLRYLQQPDAAAQSEFKEAVAALRA